MSRRWTLADYEQPSKPNQISDLQKLMHWNIITDAVNVKIYPCISQSTWLTCSKAGLFHAVKIFDTSIPLPLQTAGYEKEFIVSQYDKDINRSTCKEEKNVIIIKWILTGLNDSSNVKYQRWHRNSHVFHLIRFKVKLDENASEMKGICADAMIWKGFLHYFQSII